MVGIRHMSMFGYTKDKIMYEKSGVIKPHKPVVLGFDMPLNIAIAEANKKKSPYYIIYPSNPNNYTFDELNIKMARKALELIKEKFPITEEAMTKGLKIRKIGRFETVSRKVIEKLGVKWMLPKLPHKVVIEWKADPTVLVCFTCK